MEVYYDAGVINFFSISTYDNKCALNEFLNFRLSIQHISSMIPDLFMNSNDEITRKLGEKLDLFESFDTGFEWVMGYTHAILDSSPYLPRVIHFFNKTEDTYIINENVWISNISRPTKP